MTVMVNGWLMAGEMLHPHLMRISFWMLDGVCGALPHANSNDRVRSA